MPKEVAAYDTRNDVRISLGTKSFRDAVNKAEIYNRQMESYWGALILSGIAQGAHEKYEAAVELAKAQGFAYTTNDSLAVAPFGQLLERFQQPIDNQPIAEAILGGVEQPKILLSAALEEFLQASVEKLIGKSENQRRKWRNPRISAINNFIKLREDKPIQDIDRVDMLAFREWWGERIAKGYVSDTANRQMVHLKHIVVTVGKLHQLDIDESIFKDLRFAVKDVSRPPFESDYVKQVLLKGLSGMSEDAQCVVEILAETGARPTEIIGLTEDDIFLDGRNSSGYVPHIWIRRNLKTKQSERKIPLVGVALEAFKKFPRGFDHWPNSDVFSAAVNKYLRERGLLPTENHTLYSLRHTFMDRLCDAQVPEKMIDSLMGHKTKGSKYGRGYMLEAKHKWLLKIAYKYN